MLRHRSLLDSTLLASSLGFTGLVLTIAVAPQSVADKEPLVASTPCASAIRDAANPQNCIAASTDPTIGSLFPLSQELQVDALGRVGLAGPTLPAVDVAVRGNLLVSEGDNLGDVQLRTIDSSGFTAGLIETFGIFGGKTSLISTVTGEPNVGALATRASNVFLTLLTTPAGSTSAGYVSVLESNVETAGINGATGDVFGASKSFVQPHPSDPSLEIRYVSLEGPEHGVYFRGSSRLAGGEARIEVPESFRLVARPEGLTVSITPTGPSRGLYVAEKGLDTIVVRENPGGPGSEYGSVAFDYLVHGVRAAMPDLDPIGPNRRFAPEPGARIEPGQLPGRYRELLIENGTLNADGSVNEAAAVRAGWRLEQGRWTGGQRAAALPDEGE